MARPAARTLLRAFAGLLLGLVLALTGNLADAGDGCGCPMTHEAGASCCCDSTAGLLTWGGQSCASPCADAPEIAVAAPPLAPMLVVPVLAAATRPAWPIPLPVAETEAPQLPERARPPPGRPTWLENRSLLL